MIVVVCINSFGEITRFVMFVSNFSMYPKTLYDIIAIDL